MKSMSASSYNTPMRRSLAALMLAASLLGGCAAMDGARPLTTPGTSRAEVLAHEGDPTRVWPEADGGSTLEYATQPFGQSCWMVRLDAQGRLLEAHDGLGPAAREQIQTGMGMEQVARLLGRERRRMAFELSGEEVWDWNVAPQDASGLLSFNVHFKDGLVARTSYSYATRGRMFKGN
jgi:hypothetical protein